MIREKRFFLALCSNDLQKCTADDTELGVYICRLQHFVYVLISQFILLDQMITLH